LKNNDHNQLLSKKDSIEKLGDNGYNTSSTANDKGFFIQESNWNFLGRKALRGP
jgi:hypothetical protein